MGAEMLSLLGGIGGGILGMLQNRIAREEYYQNERAKAQYNSIGNQLNQWMTAGLNPNSFNGSFQPATGTPPQPFQVGQGIANAFNNAAQLRQSKEIANMSNQVKMKELALDNKYYDIALGDATMRKELHDVTLKRAKQAYRLGNIDLAKSWLDFAFAVETYDDRKDISSSNASEAREFARRYPEYLGTKITHEIEQANSLRHGRRIADQRLVYDYDRLYQDDAHFYDRQYDSNYNKAADRSLRKYSIDLNDIYRNNRMDFDEYKFGETMRHKTGQKFLNSLKFGKRRFYLPSNYRF